MYCNIVLYCIRQKMMRKQVRCLSPPLLLWMSQNHRNTPPLIIRNLCMYNAVFHFKKLKLKMFYNFYKIGNHCGGHF